MSKHRCPECGSSRASSDGDMIYELCGADCEPMPTYFYGWWICEDCGHQWRYQDDALNPGGEQERQRRSRREVTKPQLFQPESA